MEFEYSIINDAVCITGLQERCEELCIPDYIDGREVAYIGSNAFNGNRHLKKVSLGKNVRVVEDHAFFYCTELRELE